GGVHDDRQVPHPLLVEPADQRFAGACGGLPVDVRDLVAGLVVLQVVEVLAAALEQRAAAALDQAARPVRGVQVAPCLDAGQQRGGHGVVSRSVRLVLLVAQGMGTAWKTASMICSGLMPLASASKVSTRRWRSTAYRIARTSSGMT